MLNNVCIVNVCYRLWRHNLLSNQVVFSTWTKNQDKNVHILRTKRAFKMKYKPFFISFEELSLKEMIKKFFGGWVSDFKFNSFTLCKVRQHREMWNSCNKITLTRFTECGEILEWSRTRKFRSLPIRATLLPCSQKVLQLTKVICLARFTYEITY